MQFLSAGRYIGNVVDGKVTIYGGKKEGGTMMRALDLLAEFAKGRGARRTQERQIAEAQKTLMAVSVT